MNVDIRNGGEGCVIRLKGELDHHAAKLAIAELNEYIDHVMPARVVFDLTDLSFMDSSGIAFMLNAYKRLNDVGGTVSIERAPKAASKVLMAAGLNKIIPIRTI